MTSYKNKCLEALNEADTANAYDVGMFHAQKSTVFALLAILEEIQKLGKSKESRE